MNHMEIQFAFQVVQFFCLQSHLKITHSSSFFFPLQTSSQNIKMKFVKKGVQVVSVPLHYFWRWCVLTWLCLFVQLFVGLIVPFHKPGQQSKSHSLRFWFTNFCSWEGCVGIWVNVILITVWLSKWSCTTRRRTRNLTSESASVVSQSHLRLLHTCGFEDNKKMCYFEGFIKFSSFLGDQIRSLARFLWIWLDDWCW